MGNVRVKMNSRGAREILTSSEVEQELRRRAEAIANAAGPGHIVDSSKGRNRARAAVITATVEAMLGEAIDHNLTRAIDAGRG